jgi:transcriptional regulator with XRE-family HTH domain
MNPTHPKLTKKASPKSSLLAHQLGRSIARERQARKMTQEQLAERLSVEQETISRFERGVVVPPLQRLLQIAEVFGISVQDLLGRSGSSPRDYGASITKLMEGLSSSDRVLVHRWLEELCTRLMSNPTSDQRSSDEGKDSRG